MYFHLYLTPCQAGHLISENIRVEEEKPERRILLTEFERDKICHALMLMRTMAKYGNKPQTKKLAQEAIDSLDGAVKADIRIS